MTAPTPDTDVAYAAGAEAMREACADLIRSIRIGPRFPGAEFSAQSVEMFAASLATTIARLPLPPFPEPDDA